MTSSLYRQVPIERFTKAELVDYVYELEDKITFCKNSSLESAAARKKLEGKVEGLIAAIRAMTSTEPWKGLVVP